MESEYGRSGLLTVTIKAEFPEKITFNADDAHWEKQDDSTILVLRHRNSYVRSGLRNALIREGGVTGAVAGTGTPAGGAAIGFLGVSNNATAVTGDTRFLNGAAAGAAANTIIKAVTPANAMSTDGTGLAQTLTIASVFANADFTSGVFVINKIGALTTSTDVDGGLTDVIGGTGGSAPYNRTFVLDLTGAGTFSFTPQIAITAVAV